MRPHQLLSRFLMLLGVCLSMTAVAGCKPGGSSMPSAWGADEYLGGEWAQTGSGHFEEYTSPQYNAYETQQRLGSGSASAYDIAQYTGFP